MKIKNISKALFNLKSGVLEPGDEGEATLPECKVLFSSGKAEVVPEAPEAPKVTPKSKAEKVAKTVANAVSKPNG